MSPHTSVCGRLAMLKLPALDELIERASAVRRVLTICSNCDCESIDVCRMFDDRVLPLHGDIRRTNRASRCTNRTACSGRRPGCLDFNPG